MFVFLKPADNETSARRLLGADVDQCLQTSSHLLNQKTIGRKNQKTSTSRFSPTSPLLLPIFLHHRPLLIAGLQPRYSPAFSSDTRRRLWCETTPSRRLQQRTLVRFLPFKPPISPDFSTNTEVFENLRCSKEGLASSAAEERLVIFGYNKLKEKKAEKVTKEEGNLLIWGLNGIGAFFSLGMAAATICIILFGNGQRHKQQKFRIQIYSDDKESRIQVLLQKSLNGNSRNGTKHFLYKQSVDVKKQTVFFLQTADVWSTSSAAEACRCGPQTADVLASKKQTPPKSF
ncbi:hypothetical protein LXL04_008253 [Taraxacum kok-saghyz]